jgi:hypothetical protein
MSWNTPLDPLPGRDPAAHVVFGRRIDIAAAAGIEVAHGEQHQRAAVTRHEAPAYSSRSVLSGGVARRQRVGPVRALVEHGLREHDQRGSWPACSVLTLVCRSSARS